VCIDVPRVLAAGAARDAAELWLGLEVDAIDSGALTPLVFARDYAAASRPLLVRGVADAERLAHTFDLASLARRWGDADIDVAATPDGRADAISGEGLFAKPETRRLALRTFVERLVRETDDTVLYYSAQNDELRRRHPELLRSLCDEAFAGRPGPLANDLVAAAFGPRGGGREEDVVLPEAVNLWIGDRRSVTSAHRDRAFENLYVVLAGAKSFYLLPPTAPAWLPVLEARAATWHSSQSSDGTTHWRLVPDDAAAADDDDDDAAAEPSYVHWLDCDLTDPALDGPRPLAVTVEPGDCLYIPAAWVHQVHQRDATVAANWWYEARYDDVRWAAAETARRIGELGSAKRDRQTYVDKSDVEQT